MKEKLIHWINLSNEITEQWIRQYFEIEEDEHVYFDWVSVGGVFEFADYWFDFNTVLECYEHNITKEQLFGWYDFCLSNHSINISLAKYILSPQEREKQLEELEERVKIAKETLKQAGYLYENRN